MKKRIISLDVLKFFSAFMVVFYHFRYFDLGGFENGKYYMSIGQFLLCICSASIPLFFMVNGALMLNKNLSTTEIYSKAAKIALVSLVWNWIVGFYTWFFYALIIIYLIYPILLKVYNAQNKLWLCLIMGAIFIFPFLYNLVVVLLELFAPDFSITLFGRVISLETIPLRTGFFRLYSILYFLLGAIIFNKKFHPVISTLLIVMGLSMTVLDVYTTSNYTMEIADAVNRCFPSIGTLLLAVGIFTLCKYFDNTKSEKFAKATAVLGGGGVLIIYLLHVKIRQVLEITILPESVYSILLMICVDVAVCAVCYLVYFVLSKIPLVKEFTKL